MKFRKKITRFLSTDKLRKIEKAASEQFQIPSLILMENAGRSVAEEIATDLLQNRLKKKVLICCGTGNNGGDGFVVARHLYNHSVSTTVLLLGNPTKIQGEARTNFEIIQKFKIPVLRWNDSFAKNFAHRLASFSIFVDALFGIGLNCPIEGDAAELISLLNGSKKKIYAVDIPSGLNPDNGLPQGETIRAFQTLTFSAAKKGFKNPVAKKYVGKWKVLPISIPELLLK